MANTVTLIDVSDQHQDELGEADVCPFCTSDNLQMQEVKYHPHDRTYYQVTCDDCGTGGPWDATPKEAVTHWNKLCGEED